MPDNRQLLDEVNADHGWFRARKTRPIRAKRLSEAGEIETIEGIVRANADDYLCKGAADESWPQSEQTLLAKYTATDDVDAHGWQLFVPRGDDAEVRAARVGHDFEVAASWGTLQGQPGDYLVKNARDADVEYPEDVWIVLQKLFEATYEREGN